MFIRYISYISIVLIFFQATIHCNGHVAGNPNSPRSSSKITRKRTRTSKTGRIRSSSTGYSTRTSPGDSLLKAR